VVNLDSAAQPISWFKLVAERGKLER